MSNIFSFKYRRMLAYIIDMLLVFFIATLLSQNTITNPLYNKYADADKNYTEAVNDLFLNYESTTTLEDLKDNISKPLQTHEKSSFFLCIWLIIIGFLYFVLFTYFNKSQTLGKKLFNLKIVNEPNKKIKFTSLLVRYLFYGETLLFFGTPILIIIRIITILLTKNNASLFFYIFLILSFLSIVLSIIEIITFIKKKPLHDIISHTKVIDANK